MCEAGMAFQRVNLIAPSSPNPSVETLPERRSSATSFSTRKGPKAFLRPAMENMASMCGKLLPRWRQGVVSAIVNMIDN